MILGLDLSLTATGWAQVWRDGRVETGVLPDLGAKASWMDRLYQWDFHLAALLVRDEPDAVYVEDLGGNQPGAVELGMVHGIFWRSVERYTSLTDTITMVNASALKKYATGKGNASKPLVLTEAVRRLGYTGSSFDEADALWLADMGARLAGYDRPALPAAQLAVLDKLKSAA